MSEENKECIFCKIIAKEIPSETIYEDEKIVAFLDIIPINIGHTLVVTKEHYESMQDIPDDVLCEIMIIIKKLTPTILKAVNTGSFNLGLNNGKIAGQVVPHTHFHIMPRFENDGYELWRGKRYKESEAKKIAEKIRNLLK